MSKERLDIILINRGMASSREKAKAVIKEGKVFINSQCETKAGTMVEEDADIELKGIVPIRYVSRGGYKLEKAMERFGINLHDCVCMDVGASTGGFTDCMLQNGASKVFAIDVGTDQLAQKLRDDSRVVSMEQTNIRYVTPDDIGGQVDFVSIDVAFISLTKVLLPVRNLMRDGAEIVCLIKPQFEAGRERIGKKGVVKEPEVHESVIKEVTGFAAQVGFEVLGLDYSPIRGPEGNIEYLAYMKRNDNNGPAPDMSAIIRNTVSEAHKLL